MENKNEAQDPTNDRKQAFFSEPWVLGYTFSLALMLFVGRV